MKSTPIVTVYITTFNRLLLLKRSIESVLSQDYAHIDLIVADDGSSDGTHSYLNEMENKGLLRATINASGESLGACHGRNRALSMARGSFITGLDDDDAFEPWRVSKFLSYWNDKCIQGNDIAGLFDSVMEKRHDGKHRLYTAQRVDYPMLRSSNQIGNQVFTLTSNFKAIGGFDVKMPAWQDWDTWQRLAKEFGAFENIGSSSYLVDQTHEFARISNKPQARLREAYDRLVTKNYPLTESEEVSVLDTLYSYQQVTLTLNDTVRLLKNGYFRRCAQALKRQIVNAA